MVHSCATEFIEVRGGPRRFAQLPSRSVLPRVIVNDAQTSVPSLLHQSFASVSSPSTILIKRPSSSTCCRRLRIRRSSTRAVGHSVVANTKSARQHRSLNIDSRVAERVVLRQLQISPHHHASAEVVEVDGRHLGQLVNVFACDVGTGRAATRLERQVVEQ